MADDRRLSSPRILLYVAFFLSGTTALVYEVVWSRYLTLFLGGTSLAHTIVLSTFMGGLAFGNSVFGRYADRPPGSKLRLYAFLEVGIGLSCLLFPRSFDALSRLYLTVGSRLGPTAPFNPVLKAVLSIGAMFVPCMLMGGTLPVLAKYVVRSLSTFGTRIGFLYFLNSAGAIAGCLLGGFYVVERWGLEFGMVGTSLVNSSIGGVFYFLSRREDPTRAETSEATDAAGVAGPTTGRFLFTDAQVAAAFWCIAVGGALSMLYELCWIRILVLAIGGTVHSFSTMLVGFISGITLGSALVSLLMRKRRNALALFGLCEMGVALAILVPFRGYERVPFAFFAIGSRIVHSPEAYSLYLFLAVAFACGLMLVPTLLIGATLPLASSVCIDRYASLGRRVGNVFSANTLGNVVGAGVTGLFLLPHVGLENTMLLGAVLSGLLGVVLLRAWRPRGADRPGPALRDAVRAEAPAEGPRVWPWALGALSCLALLGTLSSPWDPRLMQFALYRWERKFDFPSWEAFAASQAKIRTVFTRDGADASILVEELESRTPAERVLRVNGKTDATNAADLPTQLMVGHIGMLLHPEPRRAMVVGLGSGATAGAVLRYPDVRADVAEISPAVVQAAANFEAVNDHVLANPRLSLVTMDAREFLLLTRESYDVIVSEPTNVWIPGVASLFTTDFYRVVLRHLRPGGLFTQWLPLYSSDRRLVGPTVASLCEVFPSVEAWVVNGSDLIFVAGRERTPFDPERFRARLANIQPGQGLVSPNPLVKDLDDPVFFLSHHFATDEALRLHWPRGIFPPYRDLFPRMEFVAARAQFVGTAYPMLDDLDERFRVGGQPLLLEEYLRRFPLDDPDWGRLFRLFERSGSNRRLARALGLQVVLGGKDDLDLLLSLPASDRANVLLARRLEGDLAASRAGLEACLAYARAQGEVLEGAVSPFDRPSSETYVKYVEACADAHPAAGDRLRMTLLETVAATGPPSSALARFKEMVSSGALERAAPPERAAVLVRLATLQVRIGLRDEARAAAEWAVRSDPTNIEAAHLAQVLSGAPDAP